MIELARIDKAELRSRLHEQLVRELGAATEAQQHTQSGATHEESRPENDKDTRALESSYLARGQAGRVAELREAVLSVNALGLRSFDEQTPIAVSALVALEEGERRAVYFLAPAGGGERLDSDGLTIVVVTPRAPLGRAMLGRRLGDDVELSTPQGRRQYEIVDLA